MAWFLVKHRDNFASRSVIKTVAKCYHTIEDLLYHLIIDTWSVAYIQNFFSPFIYSMNFLQHGVTTEDNG
jgi:hypothetical protein